MGLDMYLQKRHYVGNKWRKDKKQQVKVTVPKVQKEATFPTKQIKQERVQYITEEVAYWRKANAIHQWFVENVQDGDDDCGEYEVSREQLEELLTTVNKVLKASKLVKGKIQNGSKSTAKGWEPIMEDGKYIEDPATAQELLPTTEGFFFGGKDYDQYYYEDLTYTQETLTALLAEDDHYDFLYYASW